MPKKGTLHTPMDEFVQTAEPTAEEFDLDTFVNEMGTGASVIDIFRIKVDGTRPRVARVTLDVLREDVYGYLAESFGTGKYELQFKDGNKKIRASKRLDVEAEKIPVHQANNGSSGNSGNGDSFYKDLILALIAAQHPPPPLDIGSLLQGMAAMRPAAAPDPTAMLAGVIAAFTALKGADGTKSEDWLEKLPKVMALVKDLGPAAHEENLYTVAREVGSKLIEAIKPGMGQPRPAPVEVQPQQEALPLPALEQTEESMQRWIAAQLNFLKAKAKAGKEAAAWIDYIFDNEEEPGCNAILIAIERGATFENLLAFDPEIANNPALNAWFKTLYDGLYSELHPSLDSGGSGGNPENASGDADAGAGTIASGEVAGKKPRKP